MPFLVVIKSQAQQNRLLGWRNVRNSEEVLVGLPTNLAPPGTTLPPSLS
jgi:hypothetical protein